MPDPVFSRVTIIGLGLIGGSIAAALRQQGCQVTAFDADISTVESGLSQGIIDRKASSIEAAILAAELIVVAVPVLAMTAVFQSLVNCFDRPDVIVTDVGSVKSEVLAALTRVVGKVPANFVPGHPIAGSEKHGVTASDAQLFEKHKVILTPLEHTLQRATEKVASMWESFGAEVSQMKVNHHDLVLAQTSHLPHLLAFALIDTLSSQGDSLEIFDYAAGGLRDFSRIAASDPTMWRDIFKANSEPLLEILDRYMSELSQLRTLIEQDKMDELFTLLKRAKLARDHFSRILAKRS